MADSARMLILDTAEDEPMLWELTWGMFMTEGGQRRTLYPRMAVPEVRPALDELLREGHVQLHVFSDPLLPPLALTEALAATADDRNWIPQAESDQPQAYLVTLTRSGEAEYEREAS